VHGSENSTIASPSVRAKHGSQSQPAMGYERLTGLAEQALEKNFDGMPSGGTRNRFEAPGVWLF